MRIRAQFAMSLTIFGLMVLVVAFSMIVTNQQVENLHRQEGIAERVEREVSELGYLSNNYLVFHESQLRTRWESRFSSVSDDLLELRLNDPEQLTLINNIRIDQQRLMGVFTDVAL